VLVPPACWELSFVKVRGKSRGWTRGLAYLEFVNLVGSEDPSLKVTTCCLSMSGAEVGGG